MAELNYTKGEWEAEGSVVLIPNKEGFVKSKEHPVFVVAQCSAYTSASSFAECEANARLIAQAPRLYEFCKELWSAIQLDYVRIGASRFIELEQVLAKLVEK